MSEAMDWQAIKKNMGKYIVEARFSQFLINLADVYLFSNRLPQSFHRQQSEQRNDLHHRSLKVDGLNHHTTNPLMTHQVPALMLPIRSFHQSLQNPTRHTDMLVHNIWLDTVPSPLSRLCLLQRLWSWTAPEEHDDECPCDPCECDPCECIEEKSSEPDDPLAALAKASEEKEDDE